MPYGFESNGPPAGLAERSRAEMSAQTHHLAPDAAIALGMGHLAEIV
jgi:hypothetical protein